MSDLKLVGYIVVAVALALGGAVQFLPGAEAEFEGSSVQGAGFGISGFSSTTQALPWGMKATATDGQNSEEKSDSWFTIAEENPDMEGVPEMQAQMVLGYIGLGVAVMGLLVGLFMNTRTGSYLMVFSFICLLVATILFAVGANTISEESMGGTMDLDVGFYLMIATTVTMLGGAVVMNRS